MIGRTLSHYRVVEKLGSGGMGVVYRAEDTRLRREVALKLLPKEFSENHAALERFQREARAASSLDHPNICTIHDVGEHDGQPFIVMALLRGQTLRDRIGHRPLKVPEVVDHGIQIADALEAAHAKGVLHRDVKPANIFVTERGEVRLLDFGLAKLASEARGEGLLGGASTAETLTRPEEVTQPGTTLGTVAYMSPEQALGEELDTRSDLFSLGVVVYEMATGVPPFKGATVAAIFNEIINRPPALPATLQAAVPPELERIILKAVEKDRALRYQTASDIGADLKRLRRALQLGSASAVEAVAPGRRPNRPAVWTIVATAAAVVLALLIVQTANKMLRSRESAPVSFQNAVSARVTDQPGPELFPSLSPDGKSILYAARTTDNWDIYLQRVGGKNPINLTADSTVDDNHPAFSPDGERIAFQSDRDGGGIYLMGATGESVRRLTDFGYHPAWSPDGKEVVFATTWVARPESRWGNSQIWIVAVANGEKHRLEIKGGGDATQPHWSPNGHRIAYWGSLASGQRDIWTVAATGGDAVPVTEDAAIDWNPVWSPDGRHLYFSSDRGGSMNLWRVPIDEGSGRLLGAAEAVTTPSPDSAQISLSHDGRRLVYVQRAATRNLQKIPFDDRAERAIGEPAWITRGSKLAIAPDVSPRDGSLAFCTLAPSQEDIFVVAPDGSALRQLTDDAHWDRLPRWSPDGTQLAFMSNRSGKFEIWTINQDGSALRQVTFTSGKPSAMTPAWSPDGRRLAYTIRPDTTYSVDLQRPWSEQAPQALPRLGAEQYFQAFSWSANGGLAGFIMQRSGISAGIAVYSFESNRYDKLTDFGLYPVWLSDGRRLVFCFKEKLYLVDTASKKVREIMYAALSARTGEMLGAASLSADNSTLYFAQGTIEADVWLLNAR